MNTNEKVYSEPHGVKLAFADDFNSFVTIHGKFYGIFKKNCNWYSIPETPGTLKPSVIQDSASKTPLYAVSHKFRVSFASIENRNELNIFRGCRLIMQYTTAGGQQRIAGSKMYPLFIMINEPEGFDGYEITVSGTQTDPECFI
jgi:hypothetical protein